MLVVDRILQLRDENNLTSKELENKAGLANSSISQWKRGKGSPDEALLLSIFREAAPLDKFRIIQVCMNAKDAVEKRKTG